MLEASPRSAFEAPPITVSFSTRPMPAGVTIASCTVTAENGPLESSIKDPNPASTLSGSPVINTSPITVQTPAGPVVVPIGQAVTQQVQAGIAGANYVYRFKAVFSDGQPAEEDVLQRVVPYVPA